jgi:hypothetical protein
MKTNSRLLARLIGHARAHAIAWLALWCSLLALGGASYAELSLPGNSVGAKQIKNHSIEPVKFAPRAIGGSIRHWAEVNSQGKVLSASSRAHAQRGGNTIEVDWGDKFSARCIPLATIQGNGDLAVGSVEADVLPGGTDPSRVVITGSNAQGQPAAQPFYLALIC